MKRTLLIILFFTIASGLSASFRMSAQTSIVDSTLAAMFENLDTNIISTGYLKDRAFERVDLAKYDGVSLTDENCANSSDLFASILTINSARMNRSLPLYDATSFINNLSDTIGVVLGATLFKYNYIVENAITDNLVIFQNGILYNSVVSGILQNPYGDAYSLVFSPGRQVHTGTAVHYIFPLNNILSNCQISQVEFDAGDGNGYFPLNGPLSIIINYSTVGLKELKIRITLTNNDVLIGHSYIDVLPTPSNAPSNIPQPDKKVTISLVSDNSIYAIVSYKYAQSHNGKLLRPLIYVEGFDHGLMGLMNMFDGDNFWASLVNAYDFLDKTINGNSHGVFDYYWLQDMLSSGVSDIKDNYDVIYVDWGSPSADIRDNATLLKSIIQSINYEKMQHGLPYSKNTIVGHSMGGLITRYALCEMERNASTLHDTQYYVSFDSPHLGANVPIGLQYAFEDFGRVLQTILLNNIIPNTYSMILSTLYLYVYSVLRSPSALQMMYYGVFNSVPYTGYHAIWQDILNGIGFPKGDPGCPIENLAIVNGGSVSSTDPLMRIYANIGNSFSWSQILLYMASWLTNMHLDFQVFYNRGDGGAVSTSSAKYIKKFLWWEKEIDILGGIKTNYSINGTIGYDIKASSVLTSMSLEPGESVDTVSVISGALPFVPVASAFAMEDSNSSYSRNFTLNPPIPFVDTPFESYYYPDDGYYRHERLDTLKLRWVYKQTNMKISSVGDFIQTGDSLSVQTVGFGYYNSSWSTSDPSVATINCDTVIVHNPGPVRITYSCSDSSDGNAMYYKHKTVFAGFPDMALAKTYISDNHYIIDAQCVDASIISSFEEYVSKGVFSYVWGKKVGSGNITWYAPTNTASFTCEVPNGVDITVFLKIRANTGDESEVLNIIVQKISNEYFCHDPSYIRVTPFGVSYLHQHFPNFTTLSGGVFLPSNYLYLWKNAAIPNTPIPDAVRIGRTTLQPSTSFIVYDNQTPVMMYQFDISQSREVQLAISLIPISPGGIIDTSLLSITIEILCNDVVVQTISIPVIYLIPELVAPLVPYV